MGSNQQIIEGTPGDNSPFRAGMVALAGRSNVGKSTLLNRLLGVKIAIESDKPQATRGRILGIRTLPGAQLVWVDLPGIHRASLPMNRRMVELARREIGDADVAAVVIDGIAGFTPGDRAVIGEVAKPGRVWLIVLNKIDRLRPGALLERVAELDQRFPGRDVVPVSARTGRNLPELEQAVASLLPEGPALYPEDEFTDQSERQIVQEIVREKVFEVTGQEIPYRATVLVESFVEADRWSGTARERDRPNGPQSIVHAQIFVERESQKRILVGKGGSSIREIGTRARKELQRSLERRIHLELFVKVRRGWTTDPRALDELEIGR